MLLRDLEQNIVKVINESGMSIDGVYFVMKSLMQEIENKYYEQCRIEDIEKMKEETKNNVKDENIDSINEKDERTD